MKEMQTKLKKQNLVKNIIEKLEPLYRNTSIEINYTTPFQLVVGTILSAQCTDVRVNQVTKTFFSRYKTPQDFLTLTQEQLEKLIHSTGFFRNKAKNILACAAIIQQKFAGDIPKKMEDLIELPGFGRKTANVILTELYKINAGVCVDTHVLRLAKKLGLTKNNTAVAVEKDLMALTPPDAWHKISHYLILHGRRICDARNPQCDNCVLANLCPSVL